MGLGMGEISSNTFGNTTHPILYLCSSASYLVNWPKATSRAADNEKQHFNQPKYCQYIAFRGKFKYLLFTELKFQWFGRSNAFTMLIAD